MNYLSENILFKLQVGSKICNFIFLSWSPSQTAGSFDLFLDNLKLHLDAMTDNNPFFVVQLVILMLDHQVGVSMIKAIMKEVKSII